MDDATPAPAAAPETVGDTLRAAREARGLSLGELAERTRIPMRHLEAIEAGDYSGLPSPTYATGFAKAYARTVGADEVAIARRVRGDLARVPRQPDYVPYEAPDPQRVPSRGLAIVTMGLAVAAIVLIGLWYAGVLTGGTAPSDTLAAAPEAPPAKLPSPLPSAAAPAMPAPVPVTGGAVTLATTGRVWLRVHDGDKVLYDGTMDPGGTFAVPADAKDPLVDIGRPDKLTVSLNGHLAPTLPASAQGVKDLRVGAAAVAARLAVAPVATPPPGATPAPAATPSASANHAARHEPPRPRRHETPTRRPRAAAEDETARANREAARNPPPAAATPRP